MPYKYGVLCVSLKIFQELNLTFLLFPLYFYMLPLVKVPKLAKKQDENKRTKIMKQNDKIRQIETCLLIRRCGECQRACISNHRKRWTTYIL